MITPRFSCSQNDTSIVVKVYCPSIRASEVEINVDGQLVVLHVQPYFLRLNFPHALLEDDQSSAVYDLTSGYLTLTLTKESPGQAFEDLDLLSRLLAPRPAQGDRPPIIEVLDSKSATTEDPEIILTAEQQEILRAASNDWQLPQTAPDSMPSLNLSSKNYYGFLDLYTCYFSNVRFSENEVNELNDVESCPVRDRRKLRLQHEEDKWDEEHYMADFADDSYIQELLSWQDDRGESSFTDEENMTLLRLPRKEYIFDARQERNIYYNLASLLFAYAYDNRTTMHDPTPESAWTISTLIPAFSALDPPPYSGPDPPASDNIIEAQTGSIAFPDEAELAATMVQSYRRSLVFPLYRSFSLAEACRRDVAGILSKGKRVVINRLLEMKHILDHHEVYYIYSKIWVDDYCVWLQTSGSDEKLHQMAAALSHIKLSKDMIGWHLQELEAAAQSLGESNSDSDDESDS